MRLNLDVRSSNPPAPLLQDTILVYEEKNRQYSQIQSVSVGEDNSEIQSRSP